MGFPILGLDPPNDFEDAWRAMRTVAGNIKGNSIYLRDRSASISVGTSEVLQYIGGLRDWRQQMNNSLDPLQNPGLMDYAQLQVGDSEDLAADFAAILVQIGVVIEATIAAFPVDSEGTLLAQRWSSSDRGRLSDLPITPADLAAARTEMDALIALFD